MTRKLLVAIASIVPLLLAGGVAANHFAGSGHDRGGSSFTPVADTPSEPTGTTEAPAPSEPAPSEPTQTAPAQPAQPAPTTTAPSVPAQPAQPVAQPPAPQQTVPQQPAAAPTGPPSMTTCVVIYGQRICTPYHPPSGRYPSGNSTAPNVTQYYPSVSKDPIRNPNIVHPRD
jgi:hypothetical protein